MVFRRLNVSPISIGSSSRFTKFMQQGDLTLQLQCV